MPDRADHIVRRLAGLCIQCGVTPEPDRRMCRKCLDAAAEASRKYRSSPGWPGDPNAVNRTRKWRERKRKERGNDMANETKTQILLDASGVRPRPGTCAMKAITTKYHGATNSRPAYYLATDSDQNRVKITAGEYVNMPGTDAELHAAAALKLCAKMNWEGDLVQGGDRNGYVFVFADSPRITNPTVDKRRDTRSVEQQNDFMGEILGDI